MSDVGLALSVVLPNLTIVYSHPEGRMKVEGLGRADDGRMPPLMPTSLRRVAFIADLRMTACGGPEIFVNVAPACSAFDGSGGVVFIVEDGERGVDGGAGGVAAGAVGVVSYLIG